MKWRYDRDDSKWLIDDGNVDAHDDADADGFHQREKNGCHLQSSCKMSLYDSAASAKSTVQGADSRFNPKQGKFPIVTTQYGNPLLGGSVKHSMSYSAISAERFNNFDTELRSCAERCSSFLGPAFLTGFVRRKN